MNWKTLALTVGAVLILPVGINAAESYQISQNQELDRMGHHAQGLKRGRKSDRGQRMERMLQQLDLTSEQSQQIEEIKERSQSEMKGLREQLQTQKQTIQSLLSSDAATEEIREQHLAAQNLHQQLDSNRFETMLEIRETLTSEQRAKMAELIESRRGERSQGNR